MENLYNILVAAQISLFKCKDLLEINSDSNVGVNDQIQKNFSQFKLKKATNEIT